MLRQTPRLLFCCKCTVYHLKAYACAPPAHLSPARLCAFGVVPSGTWPFETSTTVCNLQDGTAKVNANQCKEAVILECRQFQSRVLYTLTSSATMSSCTHCPECQSRSSGHQPQMSLLLRWSWETLVTVTTSANQSRTRSACELQHM